MHLCNVSRRHSGQEFSECCGYLLRRWLCAQGVLPAITKRVYPPRHTSISSLSVIVQLSVCGAISDVTLLGNHKQAGKGAKPALTRGGAHTPRHLHSQPTEKVIVSVVVVVASVVVLHTAAAGK